MRAGLGSLAISCKIVKAMDRKLSVTSELGEGSRFLIEIPFGVVADQAPEASRQTSAGHMPKTDLSDTSFQEAPSQDA